MRRPLFLITCVLVLVGLMSFALLAYKPAKSEEIAACLDGPQADCLIDIGVALYLEDPPKRPDPGVISDLIVIRRIDEARALALLVEEAHPTSRLYIESWFARLQLRRGLAEGGEFPVLIRQIPGINVGALNLTALNLLGHGVDGFPYDRDVHPPGPAERAVVAEIAAEIIKKAEGMRPEAAQSVLADAANLYAEIGDAAGVRDTIARLTQGDDFVMLSQEAFELGGVEEMVESLDRLGLLKPDNLLAAAGAAHDPVQAKALIDRAYTIATEQELWPDFAEMARAVKRSRSLGYSERALALARNMAVLASGTGFPFEAFDNLDAARALLDAGAAPDEVRASLGQAELHFPSDPNSVVAFGLVGGPMRWEGAGLKDEAMSRVAYINARLGDLDGAKHALERIDELVQWHGLDDASMPRPMMDGILDFAAQRLTANDYAYLVGQTVRMAVILERPVSDHDWALRHARLLFESGELEGKHSRAIYTAIAVVGWQMGDATLKSAALDRLAKSELNQRDPAGILDAGILFEALSHPPRP